MPVSAERVSARASTLGSIASTLPGISSASSLQRSASTKAGIQRTEKDALELLAAPRRRRRWRNNGTIAPRAVSSTAQTATRPNHRTLGATSSTCPAPAATSHPRTSPTGTANAAAAAPRGSGTGVWRIHPDVGAPAAPSMAITSSPSAAASPGPPPQATTRPGSHDTCTWSARPVPRVRVASDPYRRCAAALRSPPPAVPLNRAHAAESRRRSDCASASTWSRSSPRSARALATNSSASRSSRSSVARHPARSASRTASCSSVASPSASASTHRSNCQGATASWRRRSGSHHLRPAGDSRRTPSASPKKNARQRQFWLLELVLVAERPGPPPL